jgi:hypothetical protein
MENRAAGEEQAWGSARRTLFSERHERFLETISWNFDRILLKLWCAKRRPFLRHKLIQLNKFHHHHGANYEIKESSALRLVEEGKKKLTLLASWTVTNGLAWPQMRGSSYMRPNTKSAKHALDAGRASSLTQSEMVCAFGCVLCVIRTSVHMKCSCVAFMVDGAACCWRHQARGVWSHGPEHKVHPAPKNA